MKKELELLLISQWGISKSLLDLAREIEKENLSFEDKCESRAQVNFLKILQAFRNAHVDESRLHESHGYGYFDPGREALEQVYATVFGGEDALVRAQVVSGTHAIRTALFGLLRPGDELLAIPSTPYDTLLPLLGVKANPGSLKAWGVKVSCVDFQDLLENRVVFSNRLKAVFIQRSKGYRWQESISVEKIKSLIQKIKSHSSKTIVIVDNCYGEFVEAKEPCKVGADLVAGSLMKNPGGALSPTGGYVAGRKDLVLQAAEALTAPGLGKEVGPSLGLTRSFLTGLFLAPQFVGEALKTAQFGARLFHRLGYQVLPGPEEERTDIIQAIELGSREKVLAFARGIQSAGPLDQAAIPVGAPMAGYADEIIMSGGTFVQGGSLELSCDAPLRSPYVVYVQGGLSAVHGKLGYLLAAQALAGLSPSSRNNSKS